MVWLFSLPKEGREKKSQKKKEEETFVSIGSSFPLPIKGRTKGEKIIKKKKKTFISFVNSSQLVY